MKVIQYIQSNDPFNTGVVEAPVPVTYYTGNDLAQAMAAMVNAAAGPDDPKWYTVLSVTLDIATPKV